MTVHRDALVYVLKVKSKRNSECNYAFDKLDWSNWFIDLSSSRLHLHVSCLDHESVQRVYCRKALQPRLAMVNGELYWLVDRP